MATVAHEIGRSASARYDDSASLVPVIADGYDGARVVLVRFTHLPRLGDRFSLGGGAWEIVHEGDHVRGFVARPVPTGRCVR